MQKDFENGKCTHCKEKIPVGAIFGLVLLKVSHELSGRHPCWTNSQDSRIVLQRLVVRTLVPILAGISVAPWQPLASVEKTGDLET